MAGNNYYSVRMHASVMNRHLSGAERIVPGKKIDRTVSELIERAMSRADSPDRIRVTIDNLGPVIARTVKGLDICTVNAPDPETARSRAAARLKLAGVSEKAVKLAMHLLATGPGPDGTNMRGAMIMDAKTGNRLEQDRSRGVRASRFDWSEEARDRIRQLLSDHGLTHFRIVEAVALATKITHGPGVIAELCWSDDPDYTAGYVASSGFGYVRFPRCKHPGTGKGGRAIFVESGLCADPLIDYLQNEPVLITDAGKYYGDVS